MYLSHVYKSFYWSIIWLIDWLIGWRYRAAAPEPPERQVPGDVLQVRVSVRGVLHALRHHPQQDLAGDAGHQGHVVQQFQKWRENAGVFVIFWFFQNNFFLIINEFYNTVTLLHVYMYIGKLVEKTTKKGKLAESGIF